MFVAIAALSAASWFNVAGIRAGMIGIALFYFSESLGKSM
jgi:hypothetical protein